MRISDWSSDVCSSDLTTMQAWPQKTREFHNHHFDSTIWNDFRFRDDDIVIATYAKSGTTWVQQIVGQLIFEGCDDLPVVELSPWLDLRVPPKEVKLPEVEKQTHRRFLKTHLRVDALVFSPKACYIYIRSEEHTYELQSLMRTSYSVYCVYKKLNQQYIHIYTYH